MDQTFCYKIRQYVYAKMTINGSLIYQNNHNFIWYYKIPMWFLNVVPRIPCPIIKSYILVALKKQELCFPKVFPSFQNKWTKTVFYSIIILIYQRWHREMEIPWQAGNIGFVTLYKKPRGRISQCIQRLKFDWTVILWKWQSRGIEDTWYGSHGYYHWDYRELRD